MQGITECVYIEGITESVYIEGITESESEEVIRFD